MSQPWAMGHYLEGHSTSPRVMIPAIRAFHQTARSGAHGFRSHRLRSLFMLCKYCRTRVSPYLKIAVPDLTVLKKNNKGIYPLDDVMATIDGRRAVRSHGDRDMPVWGEIFRKETEQGKYSELTSLLKAKVIAEYVATLQKIGERRPTVSLDVIGETGLVQTSLWHASTGPQVALL